MSSRSPYRQLTWCMLLTMAKIRELYWIPRLRSLAKRVIGQCYGCKRFQAQALSKPPPGLLPTSRTEGSRAFESVGVDFAGPSYSLSSQRKGRVESLSCSVCLLPNSSPVLGSVA